MYSAGRYRPRFFFGPIKSRLGKGLKSRTRKYRPLVPRVNKNKSSYLTPADIARKRADNSYQYKLFYELLKEKIEKYEVEVHNMYNMDEKGFLMAYLIRAKESTPN